MAGSDVYIATVLFLAVIYTLTFGFCMYQTNKFDYFKDEWRHTKIFYVSVISQNFLRMTMYALLTFAVPEEKSSNIIITILRSVPDTLFFINYTLLIYQTLNIFYHSHKENRLYVTLLYHFTRPKFRKARKLLTFMNVAWLSLMGLIYSLLVMGKINIIHVNIEFTVANFLSATFVLIYLSYLYAKYSETPFKSVGDRVKLKVVSRGLFIWTLGRYYKGFCGLIDLQSASFLNYLSSPQDSSIAGAAMFLSQDLLCEILCYLYVLKQSFISIFISQDLANSNKDEDSPALRTLIELESGDTETSNAFISENEVSIGTAFDSKKVGLGELFYAEIGGIKVLYRKILFKRLSENVLDDIRKEIEVLKKNSVKVASNFIKAVIKPPEIGLIYSIAPNSLFKFLHEDKTPISLRSKYQLIKEISYIVRQMHIQDIYHGHLTSHNILLNDNLKPIITDFGMEKLRKYSSTLIGYNNKTLWSSPEVLSDSSLIVSKPLPSDDIYSLGVIIWEIITGKSPSEDQKVTYIRKSLPKATPQPRIPKYFPKKITNLLNSCWAPQGERESIQNLYEKVRVLKIREYST